MNKMCVKKENPKKKKEKRKGGGERDLARTKMGFNMMAIPTQSTR